MSHSNVRFQFQLLCNSFEEILSGTISFSAFRLHFGLTPNVPYAWQTKEKPILLPASKGKYLNVVGLMTRKSKLYFEILETTFNLERIISFMNRFVEQTIKKNHCDS